MKAQIEKAPVENVGVEITSETSAERTLLEGLWSRHAAPVMFTRNGDGSVTLTIGPGPADDDQPSSSGQSSGG